MRTLTIAFLCLVNTLLLAQDNASEDPVINSLQQKIQSSKDGEKLQWMDSLANYRFRHRLIENDSIYKETIQLALSLDSATIAARQIAHEMGYLNNYLGTPDASLELAEKHKNLLNKVKDPSVIANFYLNIGDAYFFTSQNMKSVEYYNLVEEVSEKNGLERYLGLSKLYRGSSYSMNGDFAKSSKDFQDGIKIFKKSKDTFNVLGGQTSLAILYAQNGFFKEAKKIRDEAIELALSINSTDHLIPIYYNNATDARKQGKQQERIDYLLKAYDLMLKESRKGIYYRIIVSTIVEAYAQAGDVENAETYLVKLKDFLEEEGIGLDNINYVSASKHVALAKRNYQKALQLGLQHLQQLKAGENYEDIMNAERFMADVYELLGEKQNAYPHYKTYAKIRDSVMDVQKINTLSYYQTLYETEKRDATIASQENEIALLDAKNRIKKQWIWFGGIGLLFLFGGILLIRSRNYARKQQQIQEHFSQELIKSQEEQQTRVSRELHDSVGQKLMLLTKKTKSLGDPDMQDLATSTLQELRSISRGLHPSIIEKLGVTAAINSLIHEVDANSNIFFTSEIENIDSYLGKEEGLHLYRILQELLNNLVKHSNAKSASIVLERKNGQIHLFLEENGSGFNISEKINNPTSMGMKTLKERTKIIRGYLTFEMLPKGMLTKLLIPIQNA